ncbi:DUF896 domain-containing protein [Clostridium sp.]|jgi:uncharacterized protein YnzC (UPF0291/DUF896 family)|uniref:DUF896 domain-containing protein n=1 Tax=Clostridium sp. TaxID=1506 RepID=UPI003EEE636C
MHKKLKIRSGIVDELTKRINYLYKKSKEEGLTEQEKIEQQELRQKYIDNVKRNFKSQLDTIKKV